MYRRGYIGRSSNPEAGCLVTQATVEVRAAWNGKLVVYSHVYMGVRLCALSITIPGYRRHLRDAGMGALFTDGPSGVPCRHPTPKGERLKMAEEGHLSSRRSCHGR